jgi:threonine synthase
VESIIEKGNVPMPEKLAAFMKDEKKSIPLNNEYANFRNYLMYEVFQEISG